MADMPEKSEAAKREEAIAILSRAGMLEAAPGQ